MSQSALLREITATYLKFGWSLRGLLLTVETQRELAQSNWDFADEKIPVENSAINAIWFSRVSGNRETWELRLLSESAFALLESFESTTPEFERVQRRTMMTDKLRANALKFKV